VLLGPAMRQLDPVERPFAAVGEDMECAVGVTTHVADPAKLDDGVIREPGIESDVETTAMALVKDRRRA
jgi:hypothetical protein